MRETHNIKRCECKKGCENQCECGTFSSSKNDPSIPGRSFQLQGCQSCKVWPKIIQVWKNISKPEERGAVFWICSMLQNTKNIRPKFWTSQLVASSTPSCACYWNVEHSIEWGIWNHDWILACFIELTGVLTLVATWGVAPNTRLVWMQVAYPSLKLTNEGTPCYVICDSYNKTLKVAPQKFATSQTSRYAFTFEKRHSHLGWQTC
jgi:hypothetical protein